MVKTVVFKVFSIFVVFCVGLVCYQFVVDLLAPNHSKIRPKLQKKQRNFEARIWKTFFGDFWRHLGQKSDSGAQKSGWSNPLVRKK